MLKPHRRDSAATRRAILDSARTAFVDAGYDGAGVREIAAGAGVTAMMVNRYFGSKETLFAEVVAEIMAGPRVLTDELMARDDAGLRLAQAVVDMTGRSATPLDGFLIMARSASSPRAAEIARVEIARHHQKTVAQALGGPDGATRAALILSLVAGVQVMRQGLGLTALTEADPEALTRLLGRQFQDLIRSLP